jgi:hypothetical protein
MPTLFVASKSVPSTVTESPGSPVAGVNVMPLAAPLTINDEIAKPNRKSETKTMHTFLFIQSHLQISSRPPKLKRRLWIYLQQQSLNFLQYLSIN